MYAQRNKILKRRFIMKIERLIFLILFNIFAMNSYSLEFKSLISDHYKNIQVFSEEFQNAKAEKIIKILKENIFCETIEKEDEFEILASDEFLNKDYYWQIEKYAHPSYQPLHDKYVIERAEEIPLKEYKNILIIKKPIFNNSKGKWDEIQIRSRFVSFNLKYFIFLKEYQEIHKGQEICFKIFAIEDKQDKNNMMFKKLRDIKIYGVIKENK